MRNTTSFAPGMVLLASNRQLTAGYHPIIYLEANSSNDFIGVILTHSPGHGNKPIESKYFERSNGFEDSYFVPRKFIKFQEWGRFKIVNRLTKEGFEYLQYELLDVPVETFASYYRRVIRS